MTYGMRDRALFHKKPVIRLTNRVEPKHKLAILSKGEREFYEELYHIRGQEMPDAPTNGEVHLVFKSFDPLERLREGMHNSKRTTYATKLKMAREKKDKATTSTDDTTKTKKVRVNKDEATTSTDDASKTLVDKHEATTSTDDA